LDSTGNAAYQAGGGNEVIPSHVGPAEFFP